MNKKELIQEVAIRSGMSQADVERVLNHVTDTIRGSLHNEESVTLVGFGTFRVQERAARQGYNPSVGEKMQIPAKKIVKFKPGKALEIKQEKKERAV